MDTKKKQTNLFGITIDNLNFDELISRITDLIDKKQKGYLVTPNVDHVVKLQKDSEFKKAYQAATITVADGVPIIWVSKLVRKPLKEKLSGSNIFPKLLPLAEKKGYSVFFLGASKKANYLAYQKIKKMHPKINIVGRYAPPFGFEKDENEQKKIANLINKTKPQMLFLFLGTPKQEKWIYNHYKELSFTTAFCLGASLDFVAGTSKRTPRFFEKIGFEWLWRLLIEPKRLFKRYIIDDFFPFLWLTIKEIMRKT